MSAPALPPGYRRRHSDEWWIGVTVGVVAAVWEVGWVVLSLAGADPRGQFLSALGRAVGWLEVAVSTLASNLALGITHPHLPPRPVPDPGPLVFATSHPVNLALLVVILLATAVGGIGILHRLGRLPSRGGWGWRRSRRSGGGAGGNRPKPASSELDLSLDEWLVEQAAGRGDE